VLNLNIGILINICDKLNICALNAPTSPIPKPIDAVSKNIRSKTFTQDLGESAYFEQSVIDNWGLQNINNIYRISFSGQACGVPTYYHYFGFNDNEILTLPQKHEVGDANAFYHSESFIFPKEKGGKPNTIIKQIEEAENIDEDFEKSIFKITESTEYYSWDGKKAVLTRSNKKKPYTKDLGN
jgi:hypothetical protein